ncbi:MAG: metallophosphoesterase family protein [Nitrososphaerota archaeon]|nr:metallophosphoesterase family protein [Nitrososphaerota archaeon]MDG7023058.1 metallophosphoesterase family protein [Nitrososphaerota archaeon]
MRRLAVISDIHANLEALEAVLGEIGGEEIVCLGDLVDYGAQPNEVVARVMEVGARTILGNHDSAALTGDTSLFNPKAAMSSTWTRAKLTEGSRLYLGALPEEFRMQVEDAKLYFTHGSPDDHLWEYLDPRTDSDLFGHFLDRLSVDGIGVGHTHLPFVWREGARVMFNPGSVGQPRDGDRRAAYAEVSVDGGYVEVDLRRVDYDFQSAARKIREEGLPSSNADRLSAGT